MRSKAVVNESPLQKVFSLEEFVNSRSRLATSLVLILAAFLAAAVWAGPDNQASSPNPETFPFVAFGDSGTGTPSQIGLATEIVNWHTSHPFDTVLMLGDNIYPDGSAGLFRERFERPYAELIKRGVRFHAVLGNHDVRSGRQAQLKYPNFNMNGHAYRSFTRANDLVEFFALDSTALDQVQLKWLETALSISKASWKIAYLHHPIYSSGTTHGSDIKLRALLEPLFIKYRVSVVLAGHDHTYERTKPQSGVHYFVSGAGGQLRKGDIDRKTPIFAAGNDQVTSFMYFEATADKLSFWALDAAGNALDKGVIAKVSAAAGGQ